MRAIDTGYGAGYHARAMPLVAAVAASHAPNILLEPGAEWDDFMRLHYRMAPEAAAPIAPPPITTTSALSSRMRVSRSGAPRSGRPSDRPTGA